MGYQRWVCTKCGSVAITTGRRPGPQDGLNEKGYHGCIKYKSGGDQPHRWVKDGEATDEEVEEYERKLENWQKQYDSWAGVRAALNGDYHYSNLERKSIFSGCLGWFVTIIFLLIGVAGVSAGLEQSHNFTLYVGIFFLFMAFLAIWNMHMHG